MTNLLLFGTVLFGGFYDGTGFFVRMGGNPAILRMSDRTFAEYWQHTDHFMAERMKIFGPMFLVTLMITILVNTMNFKSWFFVSLFSAFIVLLIDMTYTFTVNHPLNRMIQSWDLEHLPDNVHEIKIKTAHAFYWRSAFMILTFLLLLFAIFLKMTGSAD
ncbi:MAG TPA: hypothetical protein VK622_01840 [Puia sp.]|nr:hypothetical protein [Puia sp.]